LQKHEEEGRVQGWRKNNLKLRVSVLKKEKFSKIEKVQIKAKLFLMSR